MNSIPIKFVVRERTESDPQESGKSKADFWREFCDIAVRSNEKCDEYSCELDEYNRICLLFADMIAKVLCDDFKQSSPESNKSTKKLKLSNHNSVPQHRIRDVKKINTLKLSFVDKYNLGNCYCKH